ncbi:hypothetical protein [Xanthomonas hyacinthi]|uniref:hypothetical protein n=1 Tax=Xanthomonas hyacinthi TaxID=56455 RepID=UPI0013038699|nr:hypothetical protein [Xanthomonas hyacinthi]
MLGRVALGEAKRASYQQQLTGAAPVELESAAALAISSGGGDRRRPYAAESPFVLRRRVGRTPAGRTVPRREGKLQGAILAERKARAADNQFVRGKGEALVNLSNTLARPLGAIRFCSQNDGS